MKRRNNTKPNKEGETIDYATLFAKDITPIRMDSNEIMRDFCVKKSSFIAAKQVLDMKRMEIAYRAYDTILLMLDSITKQKAEKMDPSDLADCVNQLMESIDEHLAGGVAISNDSKNSHGHNYSNMGLEELVQKRGDLVGKAKLVIGKHEKGIH